MCEPYCLRNFERYNDLMARQAGGALTTGETAWWGFSTAFRADIGRRLEAEAEEKRLIGSYLAPRQLIW